MSAQAPARAGRRVLLVMALLVMALLVWMPALLFALGFALAHLTGCRVDEAASYPCPVAGLDIGGLLYTLLMMGWLLIVLLPFMALTLLLVVALGLRALHRAWRARARAP